MTEPAMQISVGMDLAQVDRDFNKLSDKVKAAPKKVQIDVNADSAEMAARKLATTSRASEMLAQQYQRLAQANQQAMQAMGQYNQVLGQGAIANDNYARSQSLMADAARVAARTAAEQATSMAATSAKWAAGAFIAASLVTILGGLYVGYKLLKTGIDFVTDSWDEGAKQLARYVEIGKQAASMDVSTDFAQRIIKGAEDAKLSVDDLLKSMQKLQDVSADKLGGSVLQNRLGELQGAGNFAGNTGIGQLGQANNTEEKFRAIVSLIDQAMQKGERLAALDLAGTTLGSQVASNLAKNSDYLNNMLATADRLKSTELVSQESINNATILQQRYDAAMKVLETRWKPLQDAMVAVGVTLREIWVGVIEAIAGAVNAAGKAIEGAITQDIKDVMAFMQLVRNGISYVKTGFPEQQGPAGLGREQLETDQRLDAEKRLRVGLASTDAVQRARIETENVYRAVIRDTSKAIITSAGATKDQADAYDRAQESVTKHTARLIADTQAVGLGAGAMEEFRARTQLTMAAQLAGRAPTAALTAEIEKQAKAAGEAGKALALARVQDRVNFQSQTMFMSQSDLAAAQVMNQLYGNEWQAHMDDALARQIRFNKVVKPASNDNKPAEAKPMERAA